MARTDQVLAFIKKYRRFLLITHEKPDGDGIGASLSMMAALGILSRKAQVVFCEPVPNKYQFLPYADQIVVQNSLKKLRYASRFEAIIAVDCGSLAISGFSEVEIRKYPLLNIDHHPTNNGYGVVNYVDSGAAATCEILYNLFKSWNIAVNKDVATLLFTGIFTDTGGFRHSNTSKRVLSCASELLKCGVKITRLSKNLFNTRSLAALKILGLALSRIVYNPRYQIVYSVITKKDKKECGANDDDLEGVINLVASFPSARASLLLSEVDDSIKGSLRTEKANVDVAALAQNLGGGGHHRAAGFKIPGRLIEKGNWRII